MHTLDQFLTSLSRSNIYDSNCEPTDGDLIILDCEAIPIIEDCLDTIGSICEAGTIAMNPNSDYEIAAEDRLNLLDGIRLLAQLAQSVRRIQEEANGKRHRKISRAA